MKRLPEVPTFEVFNNTENEITIRWNSTSILPVSNSFKYQIQCDLHGNVKEIDIRMNQYQCESLQDGTFYVITMYLVNTNNTIKRSKSINAATCKFKQIVPSV